MTSFVEKNFKEVKCPRCQTRYLVKKGEKVSIECSRCGAKFEQVELGVLRIIKEEP